MSCPVYLILDNSRNQRRREEYFFEDEQSILGVLTHSDNMKRKSGNSNSLYSKQDVTSNNERLFTEIKCN